MDGWRIIDSGANSWDGATRFGGGDRTIQHVYGKFFGGCLLRFCALGWVGVTSWPQTTEGSWSFIKRILCSNWSKKSGDAGSLASKMSGWCIEWYLTIKMKHVFYPEILFRTFSGFVELINDHLIKTTRCTFVWHGGFRVVFASLLIHFFKCFNKKRRLQWDGLITA